MPSFIIEGGHPLHGTIRPQGAKNEALEVICASLLTPEPVTLHNVPAILDVTNLLDVLAKLGVRVTRAGRSDWVLQADQLDTGYMRSADFAAQCTRLRGSILLLGPMLGRFRSVCVAKPGGDQIGRRRLDTHFIGLRQLGATFTADDERGVYEIHADKLTGADLLLDEASVTGTANIIMAAVLAQGTTTIYNAACEPYIQQLCTLLNSMGARIRGIASNLLTIEGVDHLHGAEHTILPDMIEVGSFIGMAAMTASTLTIQDVHYDRLGIIPAMFSRLGIEMQRQGDDLHIPAQQHYEVATYMDGGIITFADAPWPGLTPDLLSVMLVTATQAKGSVLIHQKMFESRLFFVDKLIDMGAQIILCDPHRAVVIGHDRRLQLHAARMSSPDIRAGIALLIAALSARGTSVISNIEQIDRGYEDIEQRLTALGAHITRMN